MRDIDAVKGDDPTPMIEVDAMRPSPVRTLRRVLVGYRYAHTYGGSNRSH